MYTYIDEEVKGLGFKGYGSVLGVTNLKNKMKDWSKWMRNVASWQILMVRTDKQEE